MHIHILGIAGTFMSALALLAREKGHKVTGSDANCYPPVSELLAAKDIIWTEGYEDAKFALQADLVIVGNAIKRGMPVLEAVLNADIPYTSGPQWLAEHVLAGRRVIAVAGTHGKTTTTSMLAHILDEAGLHPGFLIGGIAPNFNTNACLGSGDWFVIEADEYDSAFFDKRPKFMHYRPEIAILTNLEFDHADIYPDLKAIEQQFFYYLRTIPSKGVVIKPRDDAALNKVIETGVFSNLEDTALEGPAVWQADILEASGAAFLLKYQAEVKAEVNWSLMGRFNVENALMAIAASFHAGIPATVAAASLAHFQPVKRRLEVKLQASGVTIYDDFAHHPTAILKTIQALKASRRHKRILAVLEFASFTMRKGLHADSMGQSLAEVDKAFVLNPKEFDLLKLSKDWTCPLSILPSTEQIVEALMHEITNGDAILVMSNRGFDHIHQQLIERVKASFPRRRESIHK